MNSVPPRCSRSIDSRCPNQALGRSSSRWPRPASAAGTDLSGTDRGAPGDRIPGSRSYPARTARASSPRPVPTSGACACHYSNPKGGFYAEYVAVDAGSVGRAPEHLTLLEAGVAPTTGLTALQGINNALHLRRGETILIFGASGGVGSLAVQFAALRGARVFGTASTPDAAALVRRLGVAEVIDARRPEEIGRLKELAPDGLDAVLALAGGEGLEGRIDFVRANGRVAYPNGIEPEPRRRANPRLVAYDGEYGPKEFDALSQAAAESRLRVPIAATYPLDQSAEAHIRVEQGRLLGRVALRIRGEPQKAPSG